MTDRKEYLKAYYQAHKESMKAYQKEYHKAHKDAHKDKCKAYYQAHKEVRKAKMKAWREANKERVKAWREANKEHVKAYQKEYMKEYKKSDVNSLGQTKESIRKKSRSILKQMNLHIPRYEIHHAFGYDDASKFIYCSKSLHMKIHQYLRDNNIDADTDHWQAISHIVNSTYEFIYIKC